MTVNAFVMYVPTVVYAMLAQPLPLCHCHDHDPDDEENADTARRL